jgi:hypothetical protein
VINMFLWIYLAVFLLFLTFRWEIEGLSGTARNLFVRFALAIIWPGTILIIAFVAYYSWKNDRLRLNGWKNSYRMGKGMPTVKTRRVK